MSAKVANEVIKELIADNTTITNDKILELAAAKVIKNMPSEMLEQLTQAIIDILTEQPQRMVEQIPAQPVRRVKGPYGIKGKGKYK